MRTIAIINLKGGVGKTTTCINMAAILASGNYLPSPPGGGAKYPSEAAQKKSAPVSSPIGGGNKEVLVIDADPQANATQFFGGDWEPEHTLYGVLTGASNDAMDYVLETAVNGVSLVPASIDMITADIASIREGSNVRCISGFLNALTEEWRVVATQSADPDAALRACDEGEPFDYVLIDCPPSFTAASVAAIYAADEIIIPVEIDAFSVHGMVEVLKQIESVRRIQPRVRVAGALLTKYRNTPAVIQGEAALRGSAVPVFEQTIRYSPKVAESTFKAQTLEEYSRSSAAAKDYRAFVAEYLEMFPSPQGRGSAGKPEVLHAEV